MLLTEGSRDVPVRLVAGHRYYRTVVQGLPAASELRRPLDADLARIPIPAEGLLLTDRLAARLGVAPGDAISVEVLEGDRRARDVPVVGIVHDLIGLSAYMNLGALNRLMGEGDTVSGVAAVLDGNSDGAGDAFFRRLKELPRVATVASKFATLQNFRESTARNILFFTGVLTAFASVIAVGVVYNNARIALQERAWELASLRVLGFTRGEVSTFLLGELALELMAAIPLGCVMGYALSWVIVRMSHSDMFAIPVIVEPRTYAFATIAIVAAGFVSALIVRRRIDTLDLVAVLKTTGVDDEPNLDRAGILGAGRGRGLGALVWALRRARDVDVAAVARGPFEQAVDEDGKTRVRERYVVSSPLAGRLLRVALKVGDAVQRARWWRCWCRPRPRFSMCAPSAGSRERVGVAEAEQLRAEAGRGARGLRSTQAQSDLARATTLAAAGLHLERASSKRAAKSSSRPRS